MYLTGCMAVWVSAKALRTGRGNALKHGRRYREYYVLAPAPPITSGVSSPRASYWVSIQSVLVKSIGFSETDHRISGFVEAAFYPGALATLSAWYVRNELGTRTGLFYSGSMLSGAFAGLIAAGITSGMDGVRGLLAWRVSYPHSLLSSYSCLQLSYRFPARSALLIIALKRADAKFWGNSGSSSSRVP